MCVKTQWGVTNVPVIMDSLYMRTNMTAKKVKRQGFIEHNVKGSNSETLSIAKNSHRL